MATVGLALSIYSVVAGFVIPTKEFATVFLTARSRAESQFALLKKADDSAKNWILNAYDLIAVTPLRQRERLETCKKTLETASEAYRSAVVDWCRRLCTKCLQEALVMYDNEDDASGHDLKDPKRRRHCNSGERRHLLIKGRTTFVIVGQRRLRTLAEELCKCESALKWECLAAQTGLTANLPIPRKINASSGSVSNNVLRFIAQAKHREHQQAEINEILLDENYPYEYAQKTLIDVNTIVMYIEEYKIMQGTYKLKATSELAQVPFSAYRNCIVIQRGGETAPEIAILDTRKIARLFAEDPTDSFSDGFYSEPEDGAMLRCCMVIRSGIARCEMLFRTPSGCNSRPRTLRQLLLHDSSLDKPPHPLLDRIKFAIRLATSVLVVHSLDLVHKRIHPETILVFDPDVLDKQYVFPRRLGYPYLAAFQIARSNQGGTFGNAELAAYERRGIYFHPRDQGAEREDRYRMRDDVYSLGVCLFEVALWHSLLVWNASKHDYVHDDGFVELSNESPKFSGFEDYKDRAEAKAQALIEAARIMIPPVLGEEFAEVVEACISAGYPHSPFNDDPLLRSDDGQDMDNMDAQGGHVGRKSDSVKYLELVLYRLQRVYDDFKNGNKVPDGKKDKTNTDGEKEKKKSNGEKRLKKKWWS